MSTDTICGAMGTVLKIDNGTAGTHQSNIRTTMPMALHLCLSQCHHKCPANVACYILHRKFIKISNPTDFWILLVIIVQQIREVLILKIRNSIEASLNVWDLHEEHMEVG